MVRKLLEGEAKAHHGSKNPRSFNARFNRGFDVISAQSKPQRSIQAVHHMQVMRPALGPIFPRVRRSVGTDVTICPVGWRALVVIPFQRRNIVLSLVPEQRAKFFVPRRFRHQTVPIIVPDLMPEMAEQRAVWFVKFLPDLFTLRIVGLFNV